MIRQNKKGQNAVEYMLVFTVVVVVVIMALRPRGFMTKSIDESLELSVQGLEQMANGVGSTLNVLNGF